MFHDNLCSVKWIWLVPRPFIYIHLSTHPPIIHPSSTHYYFSVSPKDRRTQLLKLASPPTFSHFQGCLFNLRQASSPWLLKDAQSPMHMFSYGGYHGTRLGNCNSCWSKLREERRDGFFSKCQAEEGAGPPPGELPGTQGSPVELLLHCSEMSSGRWWKTDGL